MGPKGSVFFSCLHLLFLAMSRCFQTSGWKMWYVLGELFVMAGKPPKRANENTNRCLDRKVISKCWTLHLLMQMRVNRWAAGKHLPVYWEQLLRHHWPRCSQCTVWQSVFSCTPMRIWRIGSPKGIELSIWHLFKYLKRNDINIFWTSQN